MSRTFTFSFVISWRKNNTAKHVSRIIDLIYLVSQQLPILISPKLAPWSISTVILCYIEQIDPLTAAIAGSVCRLAGALFALNSSNKLQTIWWSIFLVFFSLSQYLTVVEFSISFDCSTFSCLWPNVDGYRHLVVVIWCLKTMNLYGGLWILPYIECWWPCGDGFRL